MNREPLITVVTASYNNLDGLMRSIYSVCMQTYRKIEYIICDDCSEKYSEEAIETFLQKHRKSNIIRYKIIHNTKNVGTVKNLNNAYKIALGDIVLPLSSGDSFFCTNTIQMVVDRFINTDCNVLATSMIKYKGDFEPIEMVPHVRARAIIHSYDDSDKQYRAFITAHFHEMIAGCNLYIRKEAIERYNYFDESYVLWEDGPFLSRYLFNDKVEYAYDIVSIWYESGGVSDKPFDDHSPRLKKDVILYASTDALAHLDIFSFKDRRRVRYRYKRIVSGHTFRKYLLYICYLPEVLHYLAYTRKNRFLSMDDLTEIDRLISNNNCIKYEEKNENTICDVSSDGERIK